MIYLFLTIMAYVTAIFVLVVVSFLMSWPVYMLWNGSLIHAFADGSILEITWLQAWGITFLCGLLFKSYNVKVNDKKDSCS